ncbi:MAG: DPP IV N-terminal domain-containing protein, partial [Verrucomicrobiales bacterium]|nr:DPP IV N-terminal domain-containing protein [Verrucomicrobiales bacterium]
MIRFALFLAPLLVSTLTADSKHPANLTLEAIFTDKNYDQASVPAIHWTHAGHTYTTLEEVTPEDEENDISATHNIVLVDPSSDKPTILATPGNLTPTSSEKPLAINAFTLSDDHKKLLIYTNSKRVWRRNSRGDYYLYHVADKTLTQLGGTAAIAAPSTLKYAQFSPDSKHVAYVQNHNLFVQSLADFEVTQLTTDGSPTLINGTFDWVYEEEFGRHRGFEWSHDSKHLAYWQIDDSRVEQFTLVNYTDELYPELTTFAYPKVGQLNPAARAFVVPAAGGDPVQLQIPGDPRDNYITRLTWVDSPKRVIVRQIPRLQNTAHLY